MRVRCLRLSPTLPGSRRLGRHYRPGRQQFPVEVGREYDVYALRFWSGGPWVDIETDAGYLVNVPLDLFDIVDDTVPRVWRVRVDDDGDLQLAPPEFSADYFLDDLIEKKIDAVLAFQRLKAAMKASDTLMEDKP